MWPSRFRILVSGSDWPTVEWAVSGDVEVVFAALRVVLLCDVRRTLHRAVEDSLADVLDGWLLAVAGKRFRMRAEHTEGRRGGLSKVSIG